MGADLPTYVIPAKAGIHFATIKNEWIPAFAGMTVGFLVAWE